MNRFEAIARFEASLAAVAPEQRRPLVAAVNAMLASKETPQDRLDAANLSYRAIYDRAGLIILGNGLAAFGGGLLTVWYTGMGWDGALVVIGAGTFGLGVGAVVSSRRFGQLSDWIWANVQQTVDDWLDFDEPEPAEPEQRRRVFDPQEGRTLVSKYDFSNDELLILANLRPGTPITRPALEAAGFTGLTGYIGTDTRLAVLQGELERMGWANRVGKELQMSRAGIAAAHAHAE